MILFEKAVEAFFFFISAVVIILLIGAAGLVFIILREVAWYVRKQNERAFSETPLHPSLRLIFRQKSSNLIDVHSMYAS